MNTVMAMHEGAQTVVSTAGNSSVVSVKIGHKQDL